MLNIKNIILEPYDWSTTDKSTSIVHRCLRGMLVDGDKSVLLKAALVAVAELHWGQGGPVGPPGQ